MEPIEIKPVILVVDDEPGIRESYRIALEDHYAVVPAASGAEALDLVRRENVDLVLLDILLPDMDGIDVLRRIKELSDVDVVMVSAVKTVRTAIQAVKLGAYDYLSKPFDVDDLLSIVAKVIEKRQLTREIIYLKSALQIPSFENMIGSSEAMRRVFGMVSEVARNQSTVLITGESGTGKELIARAIHYSGPRKDKPFVAVDCATIAENLVESELFGHERGAFTDASARKIGRFEIAHAGTLFLDEIGNLPLDIQCKILRVLEEREFQRVGGTRTIKIDVRIIAATNINLKSAVRQGKFRHDLYYRLNVIPVSVPPLRERRDDIPLLINHFIGVYNARFGKGIKGISKEALDLLMHYEWPGNVRELRNIIERLVVLSKDDVISHKHLPIDILLTKDVQPESYYDTISLREARKEFERRFILKVLEKSNWNQTKAAHLLGIHRNALLYKLHMLKLRPFTKPFRSGH